MANIGVVIIGRNEGERLIRCLKSLQGEFSTDTPMAYVDSGSTDGSVQNARSLGVDVIELDMSIPFTMARGRNAGFRYLVENYSELSYVQFIDSDCEIIPGWVEQAQATLDTEPGLAIVCGRRRERFPEASPYNRLADMEWNTPVGEADACGGDSLARVAALDQVNAFNPALICGEEPEMCIRLRENGWKIRRIDVDMSLHDAAMLRFGQWWKRSVRAGWAVAEGRAMHGAPPESYMVREYKSGWLWGLVMPCIALCLSGLTQGVSLLLLLGYPTQVWRIYRYRVSQGDSQPHARLYGIYCTLSKFPQIIGQLKYHLNHLKGQPAQLIEYKNL